MNSGGMMHVPAWKAPRKTEHLGWGGWRTVGGIE